MSQPLVVYLRVRDADSDDYDRLVVRIHESDKPEEITWGEYIDISLDNKHWVTTKVEPSGLMGKGRIYIHHHLRGILNRDATRNRAAGIGTLAHFYIRRAPSWKEPFYIMRYHPDNKVRDQIRLKVQGTLVKTAAVTAECCFLAVYAVY